MQQTEINELIAVALRAAADAIEKNDNRARDAVSEEAEQDSPPTAADATYGEMEALVLDALANSLGDNDEGVRGLICEAANLPMDASPLPRLVKSVPGSKIGKVVEVLKGGETHDPAPKTSADAKPEPPPKAAEETKEKEPDDPFHPDLLDKPMHLEEVFIPNEWNGLAEICQAYVKEHGREKLAELLKKHDIRNTRQWDAADIDARSALVRELT